MDHSRAPLVQSNPLFCLTAVWIDAASHLLQEQGLSEEEARSYFQQLIMAIDYCHCLGIALRNIKVRQFDRHCAAS